MNTESASQMVERLLLAKPLSVERFAALLGALPTPGDANPYWQTYIFALPTGPFARAELRANTAGDGALLILEPRDPPGLGPEEVDRAAFGPRLSIRPYPEIPPEGLITESFQKADVQIAVQWTRDSRRLHGLVLAWEPAAAPSAAAASQN